MLNVFILGTMPESMQQHVLKTIVLSIHNIVFIHIIPGIKKNQSRNTGKFSVLSVTNTN